MKTKTKKKLTLSITWEKRAKLRAEGDKLRAEGNKLLAEGAKLRAEGDKLRAEGNKLWADAIIDKFGNIILEWELVSEKNDYRCTLENGEVYEPL